MTTENKVCWYQSLPCTLVHLQFINARDVSHDYCLNHIKHSYTDENNWLAYPNIEVIETGNNSYDVFVSFYANQKHFEEQRLTRQKAMRYLNKFYTGVWSDVRINSVVAHARKHIPAQVLFTTNGDDSVRVYQNGPSSCMSKDADEYASYPKHPAIVYDITKGDVCVAYIKKDERITARAVCYPERKVYGRIYGDALALEQALERLGYTNNVDKFVGAKFPYYPKGNGFVFPWFDGISYVSVLSNHKQVVLHSRYDGSDVPSCILVETHEASSQNGITPEYEDDNLSYCEYCDRDVDSDYVRYIDTYGTVCDSCLDNRFYTCNHCDDYVHSNHSLESDAGDHYCSSDCYSECVQACDSCSDEYNPNDLKKSIDHMSLCDGCRTQCDTCEDIIDINDSEETDQEDVLCPTCFSEYEDTQDKE